VQWNDTTLNTIIHRSFTCHLFSRVTEFTENWNKETCHRVILIWDRKSRLLLIPYKIRGGLGVMSEPLFIRPRTQPQAYYWRGVDRPSGSSESGWQNRTEVKRETSRLSSVWLKWPFLPFLAHPVEQIPFLIRRHYNSWVLDTTIFSAHLLNVIAGNVNSPRSKPVVYKTAHADRWMLLTFQHCCKS